MDLPGRGDTRINQVDAGEAIQVHQDGAGNPGNIIMKTVACEYAESAMEEAGEWQEASQHGTLVPGAIEKRKQNESEKTERNKE